MGAKPLVSLDYELIIQIINTIVLFLILAKLLFKPIGKVIQQRQEMIDREINQGKEIIAQGNALKDEYNTKLKEIKTEGMEIIDQAKRTAQIESDSIIQSAREQAETLKSRAQTDIENEKRRAVNEVKDEISDIVLMAASKVVEEDIDAQKHENLIESFIERVGEAK